MSVDREGILSSACALYLSEGLDGFSMRGLARALGVTAPALYRHYESKERVLVDVVGEAYRTLIQYLHRALQGRTPEERFRMAGLGYFDFAVEHPRYYEVLFMGVELLSVEAVKAEVASQGCAVSQFWNDRVREAIDAGILEAGDPEAVGMTMWAHAHGFISLYLKGMLPLDAVVFRGLYERSNHRMMRGLGTPPYAQILSDTAEEDGPSRVLGSTREDG